MAAELIITQVRSAATRIAKQRATMRALGLRRVGDTVRHPDRPEIRGMIRVVEHLVTVRSSEDGGS